MKNLLSLGTVINAQIGEASMVLMIVGYYPQDSTTGDMYDYLTVGYPFGMSLNVAFTSIMEENIKKILIRGYSDEESVKTLEQMNDLVNTAKKNAAIKFLDAIAEEVKKQEANGSSDNGDTKNSGEFG